MAGHRRIRVALVAPTLRLLGGHSVQAAKLIECWRHDSDVEIRLIPTNPDPPVALAPLYRIKYVRTAMTQLHYWPLLLRELRTADVVHVFAASNASFFVAALPAILMARVYGKPVVINHHGDDPERLFRMALPEGLLEGAALNVAPSRYFAEALSRRRIRTRVIPNVADHDRFRYRVRKPLRPLLLSTRHLEPIYNVACTLRAFRHVLDGHPDASLTVVGHGSQEGALRTLCRQLQLRGVTFAGRVAHSEIHHRYDAADIYVQSPREDNMPGSIQEAFASGTPVVATRVGGVPLMLEHAVHGLLAPSDDDQALAAHIVHMLNHPDAARTLAAAAFARSQAYQWRLVRERWFQAYRSVLHQPRVPGLKPRLAEQIAGTEAVRPESRSSTCRHDPPL